MRFVSVWWRRGTWLTTCTHPSGNCTRRRIRAQIARWVCLFYIPSDRKTILHYERMRGWLDSICTRGELKTGLLLVVCWFCSAYCTRKLFAASHRPPCAQIRRRALTEFTQLISLECLINGCRKFKDAYLKLFQRNRFFLWHWAEKYFFYIAY